jgi:hypothetical protein
LTNWKNPGFLDTLAAAFAESGNFDEAIKWQRAALEFPEFAESSGVEARQRLRLYSLGRPYREK